MSGIESNKRGEAKIRMARRDDVNYFKKLNAEKNLFIRASYSTGCNTRGFGKRFFTYINRYVELRVKLFTGG